MSTFREGARDTAIRFVWNQWAQMGVFGSAVRSEQRAADPEALLLFTLEVSRSDPRLFDEVLDWLALNGRLFSQQRIRNLMLDEEQERLVGAALAWASLQTPALRSSSDRRHALPANCCSGSALAGSPRSPIHRSAGTGSFGHS